MSVTLPSKVLPHSQPGRTSHSPAVTHDKTGGTFLPSCPTWGFYQLGRQTGVGEQALILPRHMQRTL